MNQKFLPKDGEIEIIDDFDEPQEQLSDAEEKAALLQEALSEDAGSFITCHRVMGAGNVPEEFVSRFPADKYDYSQILEYLKDNYGGGEYRLRLYVKGRLRKGGNKLVQIAKSLVKPKDDTSSTLSLVMQQIDKMNQQMLSIMKDTKNGSGSRMEMMQEMMLMKQLFDRPAVASGGVGEIVETIHALKSLGLNIGGIAETEEKGFTHLLEMAAPLFLQPAQQPQRQAPVYQQNPVLPPKNPEIEERKKMLNMISVGLIPLVNAAKKNSDPGLYAPMVLDNVPEERLTHFFNSPTGMADLIKIKPDIANHLPWFELLGEHVKALLGLPSKVEHLYDDEEGASVSASIDTGTGTHDELSTDEHS